MQSGMADLLQATILVPYPGTPLWREARDKNWFLFDWEDYERYDMSEPILNTRDSDPKEIAKICGKIYTIFLTPSYIYQRLMSIRTIEDFKFNLRGIKAVLGHLNDFMISRKNI